MGAWWADFIKWIWNLGDSFEKWRADPANKNKMVFQFFGESTEDINEARLPKLKETLGLAEKPTGAVGGGDAYDQKQAEAETHWNDSYWQMYNEWSLDNLLEAASMGQLESFGRINTLADMYKARGKVASEIKFMEWDAGLLSFLRQYYNRKYTPLIPDFDKLITMRVREKISTDEYDKNLALQGFSKYWADKIWDAHFIEPDYNQIRTMYRRGKFDDARWLEYKRLVDLGSTYDEVWDENVWEDPSKIELRFMVETGAIKEDELPEYLKALGYRPGHRDAVKSYILDYPARRYKTTVATMLFKGLRSGKIDDAEFKARMQKLGIGSRSIEYMLLSEEYRKEFAGTEEEVSASRGMIEGWLKKGIITTEEYRTHMRELEFPDWIIENQILYLVGEEISEERGVLASDALAGFKSGVIDEAKYRSYLAALNYSADAIDVKVETTKFSMRKEKRELSQSMNEKLFLLDHITEAEYYSRLLNEGWSEEAIKDLLYSAKLKKELAEAEAAKKAAAS